MSTSAYEETEIVTESGRRLHRNYKWHVVAMLWFIAFFNYADRQAISAVYPILKTEMSLSDTQIGWLGASFGIAYGLSAPFAGLVVDRVNRKKAILFGLHVWSVICMLTAASWKFPHLLFWRTAEGLGETFYFPASMSLLSDYHGKRTRSRAMGFHQTSVYIGSIAGGVFAALIAQQWGWRWSFIVFGGMGILLGIVLHWTLHEPRRGSADLEDLGEHKKQVTRNISFGEFMGIVVRNPTLLLLMAAFMCANFVAAVLLTWMPSFVNREFGVSLAASALIGTSYLQLASMLAAPLGGYVADKLRSMTVRGRLLVQLVGLLGGAPFVYMCSWSPTVTMLTISLLAWGFFKGLYDSNIWAGVFDVVRPEARGKTVGMMNMVAWAVGGGSAPIVIGMIADASNLRTALAFTSVVYVIAAVLMLLAILFSIGRDVRKMEDSLRAEASVGA